MKKIIFSSLMMGALCFGNVYAACANLSGVYSCLEGESGQSYTQIIEQNSDQITYKAKIESTGEIRVTDTFKVDGSWHVGAFGIWYKGSCQNNGLIMKMRGPFMTPKVLVETLLTEKGFVTYRTENDAARVLVETCSLQK